MAIRDHVDADFNASSREVECKLALYFDGDAEPPIEVTGHDCIVQVSITEEASAESTHPLGTVSANELSFTLFNTDGIFSPQNTSGVYYGKIKTGVKVIPYFRLIDAYDTLNWIPLGVFYVAEWKATITSTTASVYAVDQMKTVLGTDMVAVQVVAGYTFKAFYEYLFSTLGVSALVDASLLSIIPYAYTEAAISTSLSDLTCAALSACHTNRQGDIVVDALAVAKAVRAVITDATQIVSISLTQSTLKTYDGVALTYSYPQLTVDENVLEIDTFTVSAGEAPYVDLAFDKGPVAALSYVALQTEDASVAIQSLSYTPWEISFIASNPAAEPIDTNLIACGTTVEFTGIALSDNTTDMFTYANKYLQTSSQAASYKEFLERYVGCLIPTLTVQIRGNLLLIVGDKITVTSEMYNVSFTGIIQRAVHTYVGYLSTTLTLINSEILEG